MREIIKTIPILGPLLKRLYRSFRPLKEEGVESTAQYWENRYTQGGTSGSGSYNRLASFKAEVLNEFLLRHQVLSAVEFGCGDGNQAGLINYKSYVGFDISKHAVEKCQQRFKGDSSKQFYHYEPAIFDEKYKTLRADLALSLDVIYHILEDDLFHQYMRQLFSLSDKFVVIYSTNFDSEQTAHVRHRVFTDFVSTIKGWEHFDTVKNRFPYSPEDEDNTSAADFYFFRKTGIQ